MIKTVKRLLQKPHNKTNKTSYVLSLLEQGYSVSQYMLYKRHFYYGDPLPTRLSSVIFRLKRKRKPIKDRWVNINGVKFKQYYIKEFINERY